MLMDFDYRFCVSASLQVMHEERQKICADTLNGEHIIYMGLHELDSNLQALYFQYYVITWLDEHWNNMQKIIENHPEYSLDQQKQITLFFAKNYSEMIDVWQTSGSLSELMIPNLLQVQKDAIQELIQFSEKWESNNNKLRLLLKKHREQFEIKIKQYEKECD